MAGLSSKGFILYCKLKKFGHRNRSKPQVFFARSGLYMTTVAYVGRCHENFLELN